jgi:hypothetical protein
MWMAMQWMAPAALLLSALGTQGTQAAGGVSVLDTALDYFTRHDAAEVLDRLAAVRPVPVSLAERERVLATLPAEGEVTGLNAGQRRKLAAVRHVLEPHGREAVYVVKVIDVPQAFVGLHARAVVLVSRPALDLLGPEELQALVAHEIGHEYFWSEYFRARRDDDRPGLQRLELLCDGFAIVTLRRAGTDPAYLSSAVERVVRYNRDRFGALANEDHYPSIGERQTFARRLVAWLTATAAAG